jgi:site-specific recombinase XerD
LEKRSYHEQRNINNIKKIRELSSDMPKWFIDFLRAGETTLAPLTRLNYCFDTRIFLNHLINENKHFSGYKMQDITVKMLESLTLTDLEVYVEYLGYYIKTDDTEYENGEHGKARKIASLRTIFKYLYKKELIHANPAELLNMPKRHEKSIIRLTPDEVSSIIKAIENGDGLTERQKAYHIYTRKRDIAIIVLFLTTGIRISELVGLNIQDINFSDFSFKITRKGGNQSILYFGPETEEALTEYIEERKIQEKYALDAPLFLSLQDKRITTRTVENLVKKYTKIVSPLKNISPHKLRSTYGTMLYQNTGDIYLVADVLGHKDINTTKKHYAAMAEENRKMAAKAVRLRNNDGNDKDEA